MLRGLLKRFPRRIRKILTAHHADGVVEADCLACSAPCCSQGGFAIIDNVIKIFDLYERGGLRRDDYRFKSNLSFKDFVFTYFDVYTQTVGPEGHESSIVFFHMKNLSSDGNLISVPPVGYYWSTRVELFKANPWLNRGCVFLSKQVHNWPHDDGDSSRHCLLHSTYSNSSMTAKPIDCVFYTCNDPINAREPTRETTDAWFEGLALEYPNSVARFEDMIGTSDESTEV